MFELPLTNPCVYFCEMGPPVCTLLFSMFGVRFGVTGMYPIWMPFRIFLLGRSADFLLPFLPLFRSFGGILRLHLERPQRSIC